VFTESKKKSRIINVLDLSEEIDPMDIQFKNTFDESKKERWDRYRRVQQQAEEEVYYFNKREEKK
jgi:hypothetical protein